MTAVTPVSVFCQDQFRRNWVLNNMPVLAGSYPNPTIIKCPHGVCKERPDLENEPIETYHFVNPDSDSLNTFYNSWHRYFKQQGFDFVKVDNQLVVEKMAVNNYPIFTLSDSMHKALYRSVNKYFNGAIINCMDMTADAYLNFGSSAIARTSEDYFPHEPGETYNLQKGNAAAQVLQAIYNSIYFGQMVYPDFDLFQSHNPREYTMQLPGPLIAGQFI